MIDHVEKSQQENYPGLTVIRDGDAIVVRIPVRFYRRNGRQMVLKRGVNGQAALDRETNGSLVSALAKAPRHTAGRSNLNLANMPTSKTWRRPTAEIVLTLVAFCDLLHWRRRLFNGSSKGTSQRG